jgi:hypothetical protein
VSKKLRGVIFGQHNVLVTPGPTDAKQMNEVANLITFLQLSKITPVVLANRDYIHTDKHGKEKRLQELWTSVVGAFPWYVSSVDSSVPKKPSAAAVKHVLEKHGWDPTETIYVGNTDDDMRTAVNGGVLFVNATWFGAHTKYGFQFATPLEVARFIDTFCIRDSHFGFALAKPEFYALSTFATLYEQYRIYSADARASAKHDHPHRDFWLKYLVATVYFSELYKRIDYVASFPGHGLGAGNPKMADVPRVFAKCFRMKYLDDLIVRHTESIKSQTHRGSADHLNQLNTIHLTKLPIHTDTGKRYVRPPLHAGKTVLVLDDFCTEGYALEAARAFIAQTGATVVLMSWLKTISKDYLELDLPTLGKFDPYVANRFQKVKHTNHWYSTNVVDKGASSEIEAKLLKYDAWKWPKPKPA